ncbi:MAG: MarR family transcriptional regulator [Oceanospirillaceae bacterium]|nr:MarR family transcriptional regulator [Oceanospirillaceae bacterium]MCP5350872.1 MarR family transcriptional regulator [Oceanospirillaceae bacterium]
MPTTDKTPRISQEKDSLGFVLSDVARHLRRNFNRKVQDLGLTQAQWQVLLFIARHEGCRQIQVAEALDMQPISVARIIDRMQAAGWIERQSDPDDRRAFNLYLCEKAAPILQQMKKMGLEIRALAVQGIAPAEQEKLLQMLLTMRHNLIQNGEN